MSLQKWCFENERTDLLKEWDFNKNTKLNLADITTGSHIKVWWTCPKGHSYQAVIKNRAKKEHSTSCPYCSNKKIIIGFNDFATIYPTISSEWDFEKNGTLTPCDVTQGSSKKVWWKCSACRNSWQAPVYTRKTHGCPYCSGRAVTPEKNDFATINQKLIHEWHPIKNGENSPYNTAACSDKKVWWICSECGYEWIQTPDNRTRTKCGCPVCANKVVVKGQNDLATTNPELVKEWDTSKNNSITPFDITKGTNRKVWWLCPQGHSFSASISNRAKALGTNCPYCDGDRKTSYAEKLIAFYLKRYFHDIIENHKPKFLNRKEIDIYIPQLSLGIEYDGEFFHRDINKEVKKDQLCKENGILLIHIREPNCPILPKGHIAFVRTSPYEKDIKEIIDFLIPFINKNYGLQIKSNFDIEKDRVTILELLSLSEKENNLEQCYPCVCAEWNSEKNKTLKPSNFTKYSNKKVWWKCLSCGNEWISTINNRTSNGQGCPECARKKSYKTRIKNSGSLADNRPDLLIEWDYKKNQDSPSDILDSAKQKFWWICSKCMHEWMASISNRVEKGSGCPICSAKKGAYRNMRNAAAKNGSLAANRPDLAREWHPDKNGDLMPTDITKNSGKKVWWKCKKGHEWQSIVSNRSIGNGCPYCSNQKKGGF